jgi:hypothetical protein
MPAQHAVLRQRLNPLATEDPILPERTVDSRSRPRETLCSRAAALSRRSARLPMVAVLLSGFFAPAGLHAEDWAPNLTFLSTWENNATNARPASDRMSGLQFEADVVATHRYPLGPYDVLHPTAHFAAEWWPRFERLTRGAAGARLEWRHTFGTGAFAPAVAVEVGADEVIARETPRRGTTTLLLATLQKRLNDVLRLTLTQEFADHNARAAVFDQKGAETAIELGRDMTEFARLIVRASYRHGDVITHTTEPREEFEALAANRAEIVTFGRPMTAYSIEARTIGAKVALIRAVDESSAVIFGYEWRRTERAPLRYFNQLVSLAFVHQF